MTRRFCARPHDDSGTSLVLALVFVTVGSLVLAAVLAMADTSIKSTIKLRAHASDRAAAEGAANIAINTLRDGDFGGTGTCFSGGAALTLSNFYQRPNGTLDSARVTCDLDTTNTTSPIGTPSRALVTLDPTNTTLLLGPIGLSVTNPQLTGSTGSLRVTGDVHSNSNIVIQPRFFLIPSGNVTSSGTIRANRSCSSGSGLFNPNATCTTGTVVADPAYPKPTSAGLSNRTVPACTPIMTFLPGRYTDPISLSHRTSSACQSGTGVLHFTPGVYYFEFGPSDLMIPWLLTAGTVIGGALRTGVILTPGLSVPNRCASPVPTSSGTRTTNPDDGVTFVFSGGSQVSVSGSAKVELCGRYAGRSAPLAITAEPTTGALASTCGNTLLPCAAVVTANPTAFVVQGTTYLPDRELILGLNNATNQGLRGGAIVRRAWANTTRGTGSAAVIEAPADPFTERRTVVFLKVYLCPGSSTCTAGQLQLSTKVSINDPSSLPVAGQRQMSVLSWSLQS